MPMAGVQYGNTGGKVDNFIAFHIPQRGVLRFPDKVVTHYPHTTGSRLLATMIQFRIFSFPTLLLNMSLNCNK